MQPTNLASTALAHASACIETLLFDLDGTLYPIENGYEDHVRENIFEFMHSRLGVPRDQCKAIWRPLFAKTNQSLKGLRVGGYIFDTDEYWDFIRSGREDYLKPDPKVRECLLALPQKKWVFTNCNEKHAKLALETLQLQDCFEGVFGADFMGPHAKPDAEAFQKVIAHTGASPLATAMFEDSLRNLRQAKSLGMTTVLIQSKTMLEETGYTLESAKGLQDAAVDVTIAAPYLSELQAGLRNLLRPATK
ncbi:hypothetical protein ABBQ38_013182 [Trebouxia sp. C0009 RCD-2024]